VRRNQHAPLSGTSGRGVTNEEAVIAAIWEHFPHGSTLVGAGSGGSAKATLPPLRVDASPSEACLPAPASVVQKLWEDK
jgi:hypothetical protein